MHKVVFPLVLAFVLSFNSFGQFPELAMQRSQTDDEINTVLGILKNGEEAKEVGFLLSLARNYYKIDRYSEAEQYYLKVINENICGDLDYKALAICLMHNGKISLAREFYQVYRNRVNNSMHFQKLWTQLETARTQRVLGSRTPIASYQSASGHLDENEKVWLNIDNGTVTAELLCNRVSKVSAVMLPVSDLNRVGSFTPGPEPNSYIYSYQEADGYYSLYSVSMLKGKWRKPEKIDLGFGLAHYIHPCFVQSKKVLYFSSDKGGGQGGFDLYQSQFNGRSFDAPGNLGEVINTDKNEIMPSVFADRLSFSSNGHPGFGGYDMLLCDVALTTIDLIQKPYNSVFDEFALFSATEADAIVVGGYDKSVNILEVRKISIQTRSLGGKIVDQEGRLIEGAKVLFKHKTSPQGTFVNSNSEGAFQIILPDTITKWQVEVFHPAFKTRSIEIEMASLGNNMLIISMEPSTTAEPEKIFIVNSPSRNVIPTTPDDSERAASQNSDVVKNRKGNTPIFNEIDNQTGRYYVILGSAQSYVSAYDFWQKWQDRFPNAEILEYREKSIFRVGEFAGTSHTEAMEIYKKAKKIKPDVWILRPDLQ